MCHVTKDAVPADLTSASPSKPENTSGLTGNEARTRQRVKAQTEPSAAGGRQENTQTRLLVHRLITGQATETGDAGREAGKQKGDRVVSSPLLFTDRLQLRGRSADSDLS